MAHDRGRSGERLEGGSSGIVDGNGSARLGDVTKTRVSSSKFGRDDPMGRTCRARPPKSGFLATRQLARTCRSNFDPEGRLCGQNSEAPLQAAMSSPAGPIHDHPVRRPGPRLPALPLACLREPCDVLRVPRHFGLGREPRCQTEDRRIADWEFRALGGSWRVLFWGKKRGQSLRLIS